MSAFQKYDYWNPRLRGRAFALECIVADASGLVFGDRYLGIPWTSLTISHCFLVFLSGQPVFADARFFRPLNRTTASLGLWPLSFPPADLERRIAA
ncbi:hypothetical protein AEAC466_17250 [Asticcacaulis sp. AC466]|uniref:hypothetical protein n=1 Tax=Asticcacaulis sp. AC466 TaxID=1282362 RepID=UPI0003C3AD70|nr:hypothetical protein [Asticcacaulis sp. AC466]ESQ82370.1 hypothetical protein AEAC466_17250 [Asticcacaulis sp. AC466]